MKDNFSTILAMHVDVQRSRFKAAVAILDYRFWICAVNRNSMCRGRLP